MDKAETPPEKASLLVLDEPEKVWNHARLNQGAVKLTHCSYLNTPDLMFDMEPFEYQPWTT